MGDTSRSSVWGLVQEATMSLRSAIQRNGIYCVQDFISNTNIDMIPHYGLLIPLLLKSSASEKKFISTSAQKVSMRIGCIYERV